MLAVLEVPRISGAFVRALKIPHEDLFQILPTGDPIGGEVLEPSTSGVGQVQREVVDDECIAFRTS